MSRKSKQDHDRKIVDPSDSARNLKYFRLTKNSFSSDSNGGLW